MTEGLDSGALGRHQPGLEGEVGSFFVSRGEEDERPGYCVLRVHAHAALETVSSLYGSGGWQ